VFHVPKLLKMRSTGKMLCAEFHQSGRRFTKIKIVLSSEGDCFDITGPQLRSQIEASSKWSIVENARQYPDNGSAWIPEIAATSTLARCVADMQTTDAENSLEIAEVQINGDEGEHQQALSNIVSVVSDKC